jgi:hypothetical protein
VAHIIFQIFKDYVHPAMRKKQEKIEIKYLTGRKNKKLKNKNQKENQLTLGMIYDLTLEAILRQYMK